MSEKKEYRNASGFAPRALFSDVLRVTKNRVTKIHAPVTENKPAKTGKRGRPKKDAAQSQAERACAYRARKRGAESP